MSIEEDKDVDLYDELRKELDKSEAEDTSGASAEKIEEEVIIPDNQDDDGSAELSEEEISKLSPRAQKRIRSLAAQVKDIAEKPAEEQEKEVLSDEVDTKEKDPHNFKDVQEFLAAVQDEPSRKLLESFYNVVKGEISQTLSPIEKQNQEARFNTEFSQYESIEGIGDYKNDIKKTFLRNPKASIKSLVGDVLIDLQAGKIKPIAKIEGQANRNAKPNLDAMEKDDLYNLLDEGIDN